MTQDGSNFTYTFDDEGHLTIASGMTNGPYCYVYDGNGLRVAKKSNSNSTCSTGTVQKLYWRSLAGDALAETDGNGNTINQYVFFAGRRVASRNSSGNVFYWFADQLGSTRTITDANGNLCYDAEFTPYGQEISHTERLQTTACPPSYKFTGYERDPETTVGANDTGLDYAFARYYSSRLGRFLSTDPLGGAIGDLQSNNAYAYVANNPLNLTDPSGLCGSQPTVPRACPDGDGNPCSYGIIVCGGAGSCSLDGCGDGLGGPGYAGYCPVQFQSCIDNGNGGFIGFSGSNIGEIFTTCNGETALPEALCSYYTTAFFAMPGSAAVGNPFVKISVLADCISALFPGVTLADFEGATPGGKGSFTGFGPDLKTGHGNTGPIVVVNNAAKYNAAEIAALAGNPNAIGYTDSRAPYENYGNNNNNLVGTLVNQVHELGHSLFYITQTSSSLVPEPREMGTALENCVRQHHGFVH